MLVYLVQWSLFLQLKASNFEHVRHGWAQRKDIVVLWSFVGFFFRIIENKTENLEGLQVKWKPETEGANAAWKLRFRWWKPLLRFHDNCEPCQSRKGSKWSKHGKTNKGGFECPPLLAPSVWAASLAASFSHALIKVSYCHGSLPRAFHRISQKRANVAEDEVSGSERGTEAGKTMAADEYLHHRWRMHIWQRCSANYKNQNGVFSLKLSLLK